MLIVNKYKRRSAKETRLMGSQDCPETGQTQRRTRHARALPCLDSFCTQNLLRNGPVLLCLDDFCIQNPLRNSPVLLCLDDFCPQVPVSGWPHCLKSPAMEQRCTPTDSQASASTIFSTGTSLITSFSTCKKLGGNWPINIYIYMYIQVGVL